MKPPKGPLRVGMWGGPNSGMTTFLAAARNVAAGATAPARRVPSPAGIQGSPALAGCRVDGDEVGTFLEDGRFPPATVGPPTDYTWRITGRRHTGAFDFRVTVIDRPGAHFLRRSRQPLVRGYDECEAFLYLLDLTDPTHRSHVQALSRLLETLGALGGAELTQHVVVCLAKYDDPRVFRLVRDDLIPDNPSEPDLYLHSPLPRSVEHVVGQHAPDVVDKLERYFRHDHIHYLATSAVGFLRLADGKVHLDCCPNVVLVDGLPMVASEPHPVNVLEPFVLLHDEIG